MGQGFTAHGADTRLQLPDRVGKRPGSLARHTSGQQLRKLAPPDGQYPESGGFAAAVFGLDGLSDKPVPVLSSGFQAAGRADDGQFHAVLVQHTRR